MDCQCIPIKILYLPRVNFDTGSPVVFTMAFAKLMAKSYIEILNDIKSNNLIEQQKVFCY